MSETIKIVAEKKELSIRGVPNSYRNWMNETISTNLIGKQSKIQLRIQEKARQPVCFLAANICLGTHTQKPPSLVVKKEADSAL